VARADELVLRRVPRHHAAQVSAHCVDGKIFQQAVLLCNEVSGVPLHNTLHLLQRYGVHMDVVGWFAIKEEKERV